MAEKNTKLGYNGVLVVNKPFGMISKDISRIVTKSLGKIKIGHVGTLDPLASGVLPILLGSSTKVQDYLLKSRKIYELDLELGYETSTLDMEGEVLRRMDVPALSEEQIFTSLKKLTGKIRQIPPMFSAVKYNGKPLYSYARSGKEDQVPLEKLEREVEIYEIKVIAIELPKITLVITCSKGTYVRVFAKDLANLLGTCGTMTRLVRIASSGFSISQALTLETISANIENLQELLVPIEKIDYEMLVWVAKNQKISDALENGQVLTISEEEFEKQIAKNEAFYRPNASDNVMFMLDCFGKAFGIGVALKDKSGNINLKMKRGLR